MSERAAVLALWLFASTAAVAQEAPVRRITAAPDRRVELDFQHYYAGGELRSALESLAAAYPEFLRLESIGKSRGGSELWLVSAAAAGGREPGQRPGLLVVGALAEEDAHGAELALYTLLDLVQNHARDPEVARVLAETTLYVVPCLNPDLRRRLLEPAEPSAEAEPGRGPVDLSRNFPVGWDPYELGAAGGPYPLCEPEARALAEFLLAHPNVAAVQVYGRSSREGSAATIPPADVAAMRAIAGTVGGERAMWSCADLPERGGGLLEFAYHQLGAFGFEARGAASRSVAESGVLPEVLDLFQLARSASLATQRLARSLPRLVLASPQVQRLRSDVWQVDVAVESTGDLPSLSAAGAERRAAPPPRLRTAGGKVLAAALQAPGADAFEVAGRSLEDLPLRDLAPGERLVVRLVVQAPPEATLKLELSSPRAGWAAAEIALR
ncbi:MAG TPA: M14 family zinc carboxypeptidase [Planctomycetota bacterium]|nr:M14 family zinc carboxypeptidase [Planctomycetota bacterium]